MEQSNPTGESEGAQRRWPRVPAAALNGLSASIVGGPAVTLIDLSRGGAQVEVAARYPMRSKLRLKVTRPSGEVSQLPSTVCWAKVATIIEGKIHYRLGIAFDTTIDDFVRLAGVDDETSASAPADRPAEPARATPATIEAPAAAVAHDPASEDSPRGVLTPFPVPRRQAKAAEGSDVAASGPAGPDPETIELRSRLERTATELLRAQTTNSELTAQLQDRETERLKLQNQMLTARQEWLEERAALLRESTTATARVSALEGELRQEQHSSADRGAEQRLLVQQLSTRVETLEAQGREWAVTSERQQQEWQQERSALQEKGARLAAELEALQVTLRTREQEHTAATSEQQARFDVVIAELMQTANEQQAEYQQLVKERTRALEEQVARAEQAEADVERARREGQSQAAALEARCRELEARLAAAETAGAELESRYRTLRREAEKFVGTVLAAAPRGEDANTSSGELPGSNRSQAVA